MITSFASPHSPGKPHLPYLVLVLLLSISMSLFASAQVVAPSTAGTVTSSTVASVSSSVSTAPATAATHTTSATSMTTATPTTSTASATPTTSSTPSLIFNPIPTLTACGTAEISWRLLNEVPSQYNMTLRLVNGGVDQSIPPASSTTVPSTSSAIASTAPNASTSVPASSVSSTTTPATTNTPATATTPATTTVTASTTEHATTIASPATSSVVTSRAASSSLTNSSSTSALDLATFVGLSLGRRGSVSVNQTFAPIQANRTYSMTVTVPQGRYYLIGSVDDAQDTTAQTAIFTVVQGNDTSCLAANVSSNTTMTSSTKGAGASAGASATSASASDASKGGKGRSAGAIAGAVVGAVAGLAILALLAVVCLRRRRRATSAVEGGPDMSQSRLGLPMFGGRRGHTQVPSGDTSLEATPVTPRSPAGTVLPRDDSRVGEENNVNDNSSIESGRNPFATASNSPRIPIETGMVDSSPAGNSPGRSRQAAPPSSFLPGMAPKSRTQSESSKKTLGRTGSAKRKPVPSLGPELRSEMEQPSRALGTEERNKRYYIVPDAPLDRGV